MRCTARPPTTSKAADARTIRADRGAEAASPRPFSASGVGATLTRLAVVLALTGCGRGEPTGKLVIGSGATLIRCVNLASGASWTIDLDAARQMADGQRAEFGLSTVHWRDPVNTGDYELDRVSGKLTVIRASSTGGYTLFYACSVARPLA
jgi:hypothetical protein